MMAPSLSAHVQGIGFWCKGLPSWDTARSFITAGKVPDGAPARPSPQLLAPNERRRAPETVAVALEVSLAACHAAGRDIATLPSVFTSTHGDLAITDYMCRTLAEDPTSLSPTRFHNSVHNAAAGYWTIGAGTHAPSTAISAWHGSFAQGLVEAMSQLATGTEAVLLVGYDSQSTGPLGRVSRSDGLLGAALVLSRAGDGPRLHASLEVDSALSLIGPLAHFTTGNAMAPMLPLFETLAAGAGTCVLDAGAFSRLRVTVSA
ncbi:MAG: beta-ketoacyl synthase chain length factor [Pseudoxanthomonas sp.]